MGGGLSCIVFIRLWSEASHKIIISSQDVKDITLRIETDVIVNSFMAMLTRSRLRQPFY